MHSIAEENDLQSTWQSSVECFEENQNFTLLIVDDDSVNRIVLRGLLLKYGYTVIVAENGQQAIEMFSQSEPDLILMDIMMPDMDGYQATKKIKQLSDNRYIPIIFLTAVLDEEALARCIESGGDDFLSKPYIPIILKAKIDALLRTRQLHEDVLQKNEVLARQEQEMMADLDIADRILSKISAEEALDVGNINYHLSPMEQLNGDIIIAQNKPGGGQNLLLGDFTGHGLGAAIGGLIVYDVFRTMTLKGFSCQQIILELNRKLREILPVGRFLAAGFIELDSAHRMASIWNCGLPDIYHISEQAGIDSIYRSNNLALGVLPENEVELSSEIAMVNQGDRIVLYSDGVTESENEQAEMFGAKRFEELCNKAKGAVAIIPFVLGEIQQYTNDRPQTDDVSLLEIICDPTLVKKQNLSTKDNKKRLPATSWSMSFSVLADSIRSNAKVITPIVQMIVDVQELQHCRQALYQILNELYSNAIEIGLLDLDTTLKQSPGGMVQYHEDRKAGLERLQNGTVILNITHAPHEDGGRLILNITHDGDGFDIESMQALQTDSEQDGDHNLHGVKLVKSLCDRVQNDDFGRSVEVEYLWKNNEGGE